MIGNSLLVGILLSSNLLLQYQTPKVFIAFSASSLQPATRS